MLRIRVGIRIIKSKNNKLHKDQPYDFDTNDNKHLLQPCCIKNHYPKRTLRSAFKFDTTNTHKNSIAEGVVGWKLIIDPIQVC